MKINSLSVSDAQYGWGFQDVKFFDLTLLVGVSGVGKTQILNSIHALKNIASGGAKAGLAWKVESTTLSGAHYLWEGEFENLNSEDSITWDFLSALKDETKEKPSLIFESLKLDGVEIIKRIGQDFFFQGNKMPKLSILESAISILKDEELVLPIYSGLKNIIFRDHTNNEGKTIHILSKGEAIENFSTLSLIKSSGLSALRKLALVSVLYPETFGKIRNSFLDVFPQVEGLKVNKVRFGKESSLEAIEILIKEQGVDQWISNDRISSGMLRTLVHIAELILCPDGTVILIDEFENSLGVNCINVLTDDLIHESSRIQFIATSHHPYIINKIPYDCWKIVTRHGGTIQTHDAKDFELGSSHHDKFMTLINLPMFKTGLPG